MSRTELRAGDLVEVRSATEILATLDDRGELDSLPFMPEMLEYCGRRFRVRKRADKVCDTSHYTGSRRIPDTVFLEDLRCSGKAHGGCQAECLLFWKESWLRRVGENGELEHAAADGPSTVTSDLLTRNTTVEVERDGQREQTFRCQATQFHYASNHLRTFDPRPYVRELRTGNVSLSRFLKVSARAAIREPLLRFGLASARPVRGTRTGPVPSTPGLGLAPGDWVRVKAKEEIAATLDAEGKNRGLWFDLEMVPFCGKVFRVRSRVNRIMDERTGRIIELKNDCIMLEGVTCSGDFSRARWFCPRAIYPYWRECWLERVDGAGAPPG